MRTLHLLALASIVLLLTTGCGRHQGVELDEASAERIGDYVEVVAEVRCTPVGYDECYRELEEPDEVCVRATWLNADDEAVATGGDCRNLRLLMGETETFSFRSDVPILESDLTIEVRLSSRDALVYGSPMTIPSPDPEHRAHENIDEGNSVEGNSDSPD